MKKVMVVLLMLSCANAMHAQTWDEWFKQKKTQIKYLEEQIAALKVYTDYLQRGYEIAREGLSTINDIRHGDFSLHKRHFDSLKIVNPRIKTFAEITDIMLVGERISSTANAQLKSAAESKSFTTDEMQYLSWVYNNIIEQSSADIDQATTILTDGALQMKDDERMQAIDAIHTAMEDKFSFVKTFGRQTQILFIQRTKAESETGMVKQFYGIK